MSNAPIERRPTNTDLAKPKDDAQLDLKQRVLFFLFLALMAWSGYHRDAPTMAASAAGCLGGIFLFRKNLSSLKLGASGLEVSLQALEQAKEDATAATEEAKATTSQLRALAAVVGRVSLDLLARQMRLGATPDAEKLSIRDDVVKALSLAGCTPDETERASALLLGSIKFDIVDRALERATKQLATRTGARHDEEPMKGFIEKRRALRSGLLSPPTVEVLDALLAEYDFPRSEIDKLLSHYRRFLQTGAAPTDKEDVE